MQDHDGQSNRHEFASKTDPNTVSPIPFFAVNAINPGDENTYLPLTLPRRKAPAGVTYPVESSNGFVTWNEDAAHVSISVPADDGNGITETVIARALPAIAPANTRQFLRCRTTLP